MKKTLKILGIVGASLGALFVGASAALYFFVDFDALVAEKVEELRPQLEHELGRELEVGPIHTRFFPTLGARIDGLTVAAAEGAGPEPLLRVGATGFDVDLLRALLSFGKTIAIRSIYVDGLEVRVERDEEGRLSFQDILDRHPSLQEPDEDDPKGLSPAQLELLQRISIGEIRLADAALTLHDRQTATGEPVTSAIRSVDLRLRDVRLSDPIRIDLGAAVFAEKKNLSLQMRVGPLPADLKLEGLPPLRSLQVQADGIDLAPLAPYLGDALPARLVAATVTARYRIPELAQARPIDLDGFFQIDGLHLEGGEPFDLRLDSTLHADPRALSVRIDALRLGFAGMEIAAAGTFEELSTSPRFDGFTIQTKDLDVARLMSIFPPLRQKLPQGALLEGPMSFGLEASGTEARQTVRAEVDLGAVAILVPGALAKPKGVPFSLASSAEFAEGELSLEQARLRLDELDLQVKGQLRDFAAPVFDFTLSAAPFSFDRLVRLAPSIREELAKASASAEGRGTFEGHLRGGPGRVDGKLALALLGTKLDVPQAHVEGDLRIDLTAKGDPGADLSLTLLFDAGTSVIRVDELMDKAAGTPMRIDLAAVREGGDFRFDRFDVRLAELALRASGSLSEAGDARLEIALNPLDLEKLAQTFPIIPKEKVKGGKLDAKLTVAGAPSRMETLVVDLERLTLHVGASDLSVSGTVRDLERPRMKMAVSSSRLDLDALFPPAPEEEEQEAVQREDDPSLKRYSLDGTFEIASLRLRERELRSLRGKISLRDGVFTVDEGSFYLYDGTFRADGSRAEIWKGRMPFRGALNAEGVSIEKLVAAELGQTSPLLGKAKLHVDLSGVGTDRQDLERHLGGSWNLSIPDGKLSGLGISQAVLGDLSSLPGFAERRLSKEEALRQLVAGFEVKDGRMELQRPLALTLDGSPVVLRGAVGIFGELFLDGEYTVPAQRIAQLTGGKCNVDRDPVIPLRITGSAASPDIRPDEGDLVVSLARGCLSGKAGELIDDLLGPGAAAKSGEAAKDLEEAATKAVDEGKAALEAERAKAQAELERAKAEAERKRKAAEEAAKKKAKDAAGKLKKKIGF